MSVSKFIEQYMPAAIAAGQKLGVAPHVLLGQWGLETGWGKSVIPGTNNLGNIKDFSGNGAVAKDNMTGSVDKYRVYETPEAFAEDYVRLIGTNKRYAGAAGSGADAGRFATVLKNGGYAEDPGYVQKFTKASQMAGDALLQKIGQGIVQDLQSGATPDQVVNALRNSPTVGADVTQALKEGKSIERILEVAGGKAYAEYQASRPINQMGSAQRALVGAGKSVNDFVEGAKDLYADVVGDKKLKQEVAQRRQASAQSDRELMSTTAGAVGSVLPDVALGLATGGIGATRGLATRMAIQGGIQGGIEGVKLPGEGETRLGNAARGAAFGAGGEAFGTLMGKVVGGADDATRAAVEKRIQDLESRGLPVTAGYVGGPSYQNMLKAVEDSGGAQALRETTDKAFNAQLAKALGLQPGTEITLDNIQRAARDAYSAPSIGGRSVNNILDSTPTNVDPIIAYAKKRLAENTYANLSGGNDEIAKAIKALEAMKESAQDGYRATARDMLDFQKAMYDVNGDAKLITDLTNKAGNQLKMALTGQSPEAAQAFGDAKKIYQNSKAIERAIRKADGGQISPKQLAAALRTGKFGAGTFDSAGDLRKLAEVSNDLIYPTRKTWADNAQDLNKNLNLASTVLAGTGNIGPSLALAVGKYVGKEAAGKALASQNRKVVKALTGTYGIKGLTREQQKLIAKKLRNVGQAVAAAKKNEDK